MLVKLTTDVIAATDVHVVQISHGVVVVRPRSRFRRRLQLVDRRGDDASPQRHRGGGGGGGRDGRSKCLERKMPEKKRRNAT